METAHNVWAKELGYRWRLRLDIAIIIVSAIVGMSLGVLVPIFSSSHISNNPELSVIAMVFPIIPSILGAILGGKIGSHFLPDYMMVEGKTAFMLWRTCIYEGDIPTRHFPYGLVLVLTRDQCRFVSIETDEVFVLEKSEIIDQYPVRTWKEDSHWYRTTNSAIPAFRILYYKELNKALMEFGYSVPIVDNPKAG